ncbi:PPE family protein [Mycolicibacter virginiensis]|uniref:PPE family protein n=1 Tax=Mycolicibacter virginiensis TaxID=1795032 RepID=A0A9X7NX27_9MYCO|nr:MULTISPECIES: PPE family protein [Mycobacteriaceae]PQM50573.1 PPE family protein [Mycolicibacter virginiensis]ULP48089.1 PPE domain-containing protein [Mycolicibacter virginiensis]
MQSFVTRRNVQVGVQGWLVDFGALPPEINSGRIYSGPGSAPMLAVASAWAGLATELHSAAASYETVIADLTSAGWHGPSSESMAAAAGPYAAWLAATAVQAERTAVQAKSAAGAYEAAFAATVPPPVIVDNRILTATLIATNILGQNTAAIAAAEAQYAEMWAQDAGAMYGYAAASAAATRLGMFASPPPTTDSAGHSAAPNAMASAAGSGAAVVQSLTAGAAAPTTAGAGLTEIMNTLTNVINTISGPYTPLGFASLLKSWWQVSISIPNLGTGIQSLGPFLNPKMPTGLLTPLLSSELLTKPFPHLATPTAVVARAGLIGSLSVPQNWAATVPAIRAVTTAFDEGAASTGPALAGEAQSAMFGEMALSSVAGRALGGGATTAMSGPAGRSAPAGARVAGRPVSRVLAGGSGRLTSEEVAEEIATTSTVIVIPPNRK